MAVWSIVNLRDITNRVRIEAEFYRPGFLACQKIVESIPHVRLGSARRKITDGTHFTPRYTSSGTRFYSAVNVKEGYFVHEESFKFITAVEHRAIHKRCPVRAGDVLLRKVGAGPRWSCVVPEGLDEFSIFVSVAMIRPADTIQSEYLSTFMNCRYGQLQLLRLNKGISQPDLHLEDIGELVVPMLTPGDQLDVAELVRKAQNVRNISQSLHAAAQELLEASLGLDKISFQKPVGFIAQFSDVETSHRSDAQHYQPRFKQLIDHISVFPSARVRDIRSLNRRGLQPIYLKNGDVDVVNSQHLGPKHIDYEGLEKTRAKSFAAAAEAHIQQDDLLIYTTGAYIGRTNVYLSDAPAMASNHVNIVRLHPGIDAAYMALVFQSIVGQFQTQQHARGSAQSELYPSDIDRFVVPLLDADKQKAIGELVRESLVKQQESRRLLDQAKTRVEQLIEAAVQP